MSVDFLPLSSGHVLVLVICSDPYFVSVLELPLFHADPCPRTLIGSLWFLRTAGPAILMFIRQRLGVAEEEFKEGNPSFFEALENQEISGLDNYNIKKNPRYRDAFSSEIVEVEEDDDEDVGDDDFGQDDDD